MKLASSWDKSVIHMLLIHLRDLEGKRILVQQTQIS